MIPLTYQQTTFPVSCAIQQTTLHFLCGLNAEETSECDFFSQRRRIEIKTIFFLLRTLGTKEAERFTNFILPTQPSRLTFTETVDQLTGIFRDKQSLFHLR